ncbi:MAG: lytic murein transglycosylase [Candidatus Micrarchaeota archaeon]
MQCLSKPISRRTFNKRLRDSSISLFSASFIGSERLMETVVTLMLKSQYPKTYGVLEKAGQDNRRINKLLSDSRLELYPEIKGFFENPAEDLPYAEYRITLGVPKKILDAKEFMKEHITDLTRVETDSGVDRSIIVAILAVESHLGKNKGKRNPMGAFITMIEQIPAKEGFGKRQLLELLKFCEKHGFDPYSFKGSYAGAMEWAHFIPESLNWGFVDGDGDGKPNPKSLMDSMKSIAHYLQNHDKSGNAWVLGGAIEENSKNWRALLSYNPRENYVKAVKEIAEVIDIPLILRQAMKTGLI